MKRDAIQHMYVQIKISNKQSPDLATLMNPDLFNQVKLSSRKVTRITVQSREITKEQGSYF